MSSIKDFSCTGNSFIVTQDVLNSFNENGFILVRKLFDTNEMQLLIDSLNHDEGVAKYAYEVKDGENGTSRMCLWNHPGNDITGAVARVEKVAGTMEALLGGEVYHYHTKLMMKEAYTGGKWQWHQDYGYWYNNGCLYPDMGTVFIAVDPCLKENGCLQILRGSHKMGRIDHGVIGEQFGADMKRVEMSMTQHELLSVELQPGDALFFHCNLLHTSNRNDSHLKRWAFLIAYNRASNNPLIEHHHPKYSLLNKLPNSELLNYSSVTKLDGKDFLLVNTASKLVDINTEKSVH